MSPRQLQSSRSRARRRSLSGGFTIVEVVVAMTLLVFGALSVVAASAAAVRAVGSADAQLFAMTTVQSRLETLASSGCASTGGGGSAADSSNELRERWTVSAARNGLRLASDSVEYRDHGVPRVVVRRRLIVC